MFARLAKFRRMGLRHVVPVLCDVLHSNDKLPGFRHSKDLRRIPTPALVCHWFNRDGRLECRWEVENLGTAASGDPSSEPVNDRRIQSRAIRLGRHRNVQDSALTVEA